MTSSAADNEADRPAMGRRDLVDLSMLADGSLTPGRRDEVEARIAAAPEVSALLENERRAVEALHAAAAVSAPVSLRERIAADRARAGRAPARRRVLLGGACAGAVAVLALVLVLALPGGAPGAPSVSQAASLALRGASSRTAPPTQGAHPSLLTRNVDDVYFPNWTRIGWTATGERVDQLDGRLTRTIYYAGGGGWKIAYTIVGGPALAEPKGAVLSRRQLRSIVLGGRVVVTWRRFGHTCVLSSSRRVPIAVLLGLAARESSV